MNRPTIALLVSLGLGCAARLLGLDASSLWFDEGLTYAGLPMSLAEIGADERSPPLSFAVFSLWSRLFGDSVTTLRLLPALVSCASLGLFALLARRLFGASGATLPVLLAALSPFLVHYAHELRMYAFMEFGTTLALLGAARVWERRALSWTAALLVASGTAIAFGSHYYGGLIAGTVGALLLLARRGGRVTRRDVIAGLAATVAGLAVWIPWFVRVFPTQLESEWGWTDRFSLRELVELPIRFLHHDVQALPGPGRWLAAAGAAVLATAAIVAITRCVRTRDRGALFALTALVVPIALVVAARLVGQRSFAVRYVLVAAPGAILLFGHGLALMRPSWLRATAASVLVASLVAMLAVPMFENRREDFRSAAIEIVDRYRSGDRIVVVTGCSTPRADGALRAYLPTPLRAALLDVAAARALEPGARLHVVHREAFYAEADLRELLAGRTVIDESPRRLRVKRYLLGRP